MIIDKLVTEVLAVLVDDPSLLRNDASPIATFGLASIDGIEFAVMLEDKLGWALPENANPFVDDIEKRPRTVAEIVTWVSSLAEPRRS